MTFLSQDEHHGQEIFKVSGHTTSDVQSAAESPVGASSCEDSSSQYTLVDSLNCDQKRSVAKTSFPAPGLHPAVTRDESHWSGPSHQSRTPANFLEHRLPPLTDHELVGEKSAETGT